MNCNITIQQKTALRLVVTLLLMMVLGVNVAWGQKGTNRSGIFYFANGGSGKTDPVDPAIGDISNPDDYFYLVPADNPQQDNKRDAWYSSDYSKANGDSQKPYLTTYKTKKDAEEVPDGVTNRPHNSVWIVKFASTDSNNKDYYYLIHAATGKYVVYEPPYSTKNNRKSVHLLTADSPGENAKFAITIHSANSVDYYNFRPMNIGTGGSTNKYLNAANANENYYYSNDATADGDANYFRGLVGLWKDAGGGSDWMPVATLLDAPTISDVDENNKVTIADANSLPSGYEIRYTTDGSTTPTATTGEVYSGPIPITASVTIKAVVVRYGMVLTEVASETREPAPCATPVITYDNTTSEVSITCSTLETTIRYTIDGTDPTTSSTLFTPFTVSSPTTVKAIATHAVFPSSAVAELAISQVATPTIQDNGSNAISIATTTSDATIYYTIDGSDPTTSSTEYTEPLTDNVSNVTIKAIAVKEGMITSAVGSGSVKLQCAAPVISFNDATSEVSISCDTEGSTIRYTTDGETPTESSSVYSNPFSVSSATTVKAITINPNYVSSTVTEFAIPQVATPTIQNNGSNAISITTTTPGATIYYTTDDSTPTTSSAMYTSPLTENFSGVTIKAIAVKEGMITSAVGSGSVKFQCATPVITRDGMTFTLSCSKPTDANLYYTLGGGSEEAYDGTPVPFTSDQLPITVTAVARHSNYTESESVSMELKNGQGTSDDPYLIYGATDFTNFVTNVNSGTTASACYKLASDVSASGMAAITTAFTGTFDGNGYTISNLGYALFNNLNGGTVKNVILDAVSVSGNENGNAGAICAEATGDSRIFNCGVLATGSTANTDDDGYTYLTSCSSTVSGTNYVGGIVGLLDGSSRVINCFSYANVSGGSYVGGIVGYNNVATTANNLKTMVMNCMFYGEVSGGSIAPIYNGEIITNVGENTGVSNFNYFRLESSYIQNTAITKVYNCALGAETRFLQRFEFFRYLLNSNRELAAWWATGDAANKDEMMKWVMEPTQIGTTTPYPILKTAGKYASIVNYTPNETPYDEDHRNEGGKLGTLAVTIQSGSGGATGASITTSSLDLTITEKDFKHFNFNYGKVQLPYYNDVGTKNYTDGKVVTGWKIVSITGGTAGSYSTGADVTYNASGELIETPYNFADRKCTNKDLNSQSERVFNQGAYWDVPEGVTAITIQPYWGKAIYLADAYYDVVYNKNMTTAYNVTTVGGGQRYTNGVSTFNGQKVYTTLTSAVEKLSSDGTVYDNALVLVGNFHLYNTNNSTIGSGKPYTVTSIDLDGDNEPDYSFMWRFDGRTKLHPVRYDFLNLIGLGMAQKSTGGTGSYNFGIPQPLNWFEVTNTALYRVTQFEYSPNNRVKKPIILQGGVIEQWVTLQYDPGDRVEYFHVGGNVWFKEFHRGSHQDNANLKTPHPPLSVTGGDFEKFYLTGFYQSQATIYDDNAECYINGGRFGEVAGAGMEGIGTSDSKGNITWLIDNADIKEFYGGGINYDKPVHGNIHTIISNSYVDLFCGGPKFGDMVSGRTVITTATNCNFGTFFGAGYGGNSYNRYAPANRNNVINLPGKGKVNNVEKQLNSWNEWVADEYKQTYSTTYKGVSTQIDYQFIPMSSNTENVARLWVEFVGISLATCRNVTSTLTGCKIAGNFYGGGSLGKVDGPVTSTLTNCDVEGNVFGAGYSASLPPVEVMNLGGFQTEPYYYTDLGTYRKGVPPLTTTYTWQHRDETINSTNAIDKDNHILYTNEDLTTLGTVTGDVTLIINGDDTKVGKSVYGGGEESGVGGNTTVNVTGGTIGVQGEGGATYGNVYGGGKGKEGEVTAGIVKGNANVTISGTPTIYHNIYGGGAYGSVGDFTYDETSGMPTGLKPETTGGNTQITITGGTIGSNGHENGMVFGSSRGDVATPGTDGVDPNDRMAWVYSTHVMIGDTGAETSPSIKGSVYGSGENGHTFQNTIVDIVKGTIGITDPEEDGGAAYAYRGNVYGGGCGTDKYDSDGDETKDAYNPLAGIVRGTTTINITGGQIAHNVYGAGAMGSVGGGADATSGKTTINISGGRIGYDGDGNGHVFGAARGDFGISTAASGLANVRETEVNINYASTPAADNEEKTEQLIAGSVFGGGEAGTVKESVTVKMTGGLVLKDVYGGGALADTQTSNWDAALNNGAGGWATGKTSASTTTTVRLTGGDILGEAYGGGLGEPGKPAYVYGDVLVDLNGTTTSGEEGAAIATTARGCAVNQVFGCNNAAGTPMGEVLVHVYATQNKTKSQIGNTDGDTPVTDAKEKGSYDVLAVYGGGNLAAYEPAGGKETTNSTNVIIDGCGLTSIQTVYGGGNAASAPATNVIVNGTFEIEELFGGGNGKDKLSDGRPNPGANVGYKNYTVYTKDGEDKWVASDDPAYDTKEERTAGTSAITYGTGQASVNIFGGTVHRVFGGSNTKGNVRQTAVTLLDENSGCTFCVDEAYGGGKSAPMDAEAKLLMSCIPGLSAAYGGAEAASIQGNVTLNITNGTFDRVFGGNNLSGTINGSITVNIEEIGCRPIKIGELYGGGNQAGYSVYGYNADGTPKESGTKIYEDPQVNVKSFTSIGKVFGGGYGSGATMVGNPTVSVNEVYGRYYNQDVSVVGEDAKTREDGYSIPSHAKGKIGAISEVFGGGNAAKVIGNTTVNIATQAEVYIVKQVTAGEALPAGCYTRNNDGTYSAATGTAAENTTYYEKKDVLGVDIRGNVYGGGNEAEVTGDTNVNIGKKSE